ncbi:MAG: hypothetical protein HKO92_07085 [Flavobacteriaceae bacterium]|nr:hypothetical protein [Flavobacteriaceae bacterium]
MKINSFDIDGVIYMGKYDGLYPNKNDIIITGRSFEEEEETIRMLKRKGINNKVYFNPLPFDKKTRKSSGEHKAKVLSSLIEDGMDIGIHFEDDYIQGCVIEKSVPQINVVLVNHNLVEKENVRHNG